MSITRILFVCHGNICRSPMAEFVFRKMAETADCAEDFIVKSAAVSSEEIGNPVYPPAQAILRKHGIDCSGKTARKMTERDYANFDYLVAMDMDNLRRMKAICGGDPDQKISKLLDHAGMNKDVADPWYTGDFEATWRDVNTGCTALFQKICKENLKDRN